MAYGRRGEIPGQHPDEFQFKIIKKNSLEDNTTPRRFLPKVDDLTGIGSHHRDNPLFPTLTVRIGTGEIPSTTEFTGVFDATTAIPDPFEALRTRIAEQERLRQEALDRLIAGITSRYQIPYSAGKGNARRSDLLDRWFDYRKDTKRLEWEAEERRRAEERAARRRELELAEREGEEARRIRKIEMEIDERRREDQRAAARRDREMELLDRPRKQHGI